MVKFNHLKVFHTLFYDNSKCAQLRFESKISANVYKQSIQLIQ